MAKIIWAERALTDLENACAYIAKDSIAAADRLATQAIEAVERLRDYPSSGRRVPELTGSNVREVIFGRYRIIYELDEQQNVLVLAFHPAAIPIANKDFDKYGA